MDNQIETNIRKSIGEFYENLTDEQLVTLNKNVDIGIVTNRPLNIGATQHLDIVHGSENVIKCKDG